MKKTYVRPEVYFESFELSTSIATGCSAGYDHNNTNFGTPDQCALFFGTDRIFNSPPICDPSEGKFDPSDFCYHVPTANDSVFSS